MSLDAVIISSYKDTTISHSSQFRLKINGELATIQRIKAIIKNGATMPGSGSAPIGLNFHNALKLNGITIYSYLMQYFKCDVIDLEFEYDKLTELLKQSPKFIIISTTFIYSKKALREITKIIKDLCGDAIIIAGGPFVLSSYFLYARRHNKDYDTESAQNDFLFLNSRHEPLVDYYIIANQGLDTLAGLMRTLIGNGSVCDIADIAYHKDGSLVFNKVNLHKSYQHIKIEWGSLPKHIVANRVASLQSSNGCPYECKFCNFVKDRRSTFVRTMDDIIDDLQTLQNMGVKYVRFADDNFRLGKPDLNEFCQKIIARGIRIQWHSFMRLSSLKGVDLGLLRSAGCMEVLFGLESASPLILNNMNKRIDPAIYRVMIQEILSVGINVASTFIIGFPGETTKTAQETISFIESINLDNCDGTYKWSLFPFTLLPGSPIYEPSERKKYNLQGYMTDWSHDTMDSKTARSIISKAYMDIRGIGPGYTSDNLDDLNELSPAKRKQFYFARFKLSKVVDRKITADDCIQTFSEILSST